MGASNIRDLKPVDMESLRLFHEGEAVEPVGVNDIAAAIRALPRLGNCDAAIIVRALSCKLVDTNPVYSKATAPMLDDASDALDMGDSMAMAGFAEEDERKAAIAQIDGSLSYKKLHAANARLIAAAPQLLEALQAFMEIDRHPTIHGAMPVALRDFRDQARAAIAAAQS